MAYRKRVWLIDVAGASGAPGTGYDITAHVSRFPTADNAATYGQPGTLALTVRSSRRIGGVPTALPVIPVQGMEVMYFDEDLSGGNAHIYYFGGRLVIVGEADDPDGKLWLLKAEGFDRALNHHVPYIDFPQATYPTDSARITKLIELSGLPGVWDGTTEVAAGGFISYPLGSLGGYSRRTVYEMVADTAADPGPNGASPVAARRWHIHCEWQNPGAPGSGGANAIKRVFHYYSGSQVAQEIVPLTDRVDRMANYAADSFDVRADRPVSTTTMGKADTGQAWAVINGTAGIDASGRGYIATSTGSGQSVAYLFGGVADQVVQVTLPVMASGSRLVGRMRPLTGTTWDGIFVQANASDYQLQKYEAGVGTVLGTYSVTPAAGDTLKLSLIGDQVKFYLNGSATPAISVTSVFNQSWTYGGFSTFGVTAARFNNFSLSGKGAGYKSGFVRYGDATAMINAVAIEGPGSDPVAVTWRNQVNVSTSDGYILKNAGSAGWDAGAISNQSLTDDGGYVSCTVDDVVTAQTAFTGPDQDQLYALEAGGAWAIAAGTFRTISNTAGLTANTTAKAVAVVDTGAATCIVQTVVGTYAAKQRLIFRYTNTANYYFLEADTAAVRLKKRVADAESTLGTASLTLSSGQELKVVCTGTLIQVYVAGAFQFNYTIADGFNVGATKHGIGADAGTGNWAGTFDSFSVRQTYADRAFGLAFDNASQNINTVDFAIKLGADRSYSAYELGVLKASASNYSVGDAFKVEARRVIVNNQLVTEVKYYRMAAGTSVWTAFYTSATYPTISTSTPMYLDAVLYEPGAALSGLQIRRFSYAVYTDEASIALYGRWWAKKVIEDPQLDTDQKRRARSSSIFGRFAFPRDTLEVTTDYPYTVGRLALVNSSKLVWTNVKKLITGIERDWGARKRLDMPRYKLTLGDALMDYEDDEAIGFLLGATPIERSGPPYPAAFAAGTGQRDGVNSVLQRFTWTQDTTHGEQYVELECWPADNPQDVTHGIFGAGQSYGHLARLRPGLAYFARIRARNFSGTPGDWSPLIPFTSALITRPPAPAWAGSPFPTEGVEPDGTAYLQIAWVHSTGEHAQYALYYMNWPNPPRKPPKIYIPGDQTSVVIRGIVPDYQYAFYLATVDGDGYEGDRGSQQLHTVTAPAMWRHQIDFETSTADEVFAHWPQASVETPVGTGTSDARETASANLYSERAALALSIPASTASRYRVSRHLAGREGDVIAFKLSRKAAIAAGQAIALVAAYDGSGAQIGTDTTLWSASPTTSYVPKDDIQYSLPAGTRSWKLKLGASGTGTANTVYWAKPEWRVAATANDLKPGSVGNAQLGTITDPTKVQLWTAAGTPRNIYDSGGVVRGEEFYGTQKVSVRGVNTGATPVGVEIANSAGNAAFGALQDGTAQINGSAGIVAVNALNFPYAELPSNTTLGNSNCGVMVDASSANITITLPAAAGCPGRVYVIKKIDSSAKTVTIDGNGAETIDGAATKVLSTQYASLMIQSSGAGWYIWANF